MKIVSIDRSDVQRDFYYDEKGLLKSWYDPKEEIVVRIKGYDSENYAFADNEGIFFEKVIVEDDIEKIISEGELNLPVEDRFNLISGYKAIKSALFNKRSNEEAPREIINNIMLRARLIANREKDLPNYLRHLHSKYLELFDECPRSNEVLYTSIEQLTYVIFNNALFPDIPFGFNLEEIKQRPFDFTHCPNVWTWESFWDAVDKNSLFDEYLKALSYLSVIRWIQTGIWYSECSSVKKVIEIFSSKRKSSSNDEEILPLKKLSQSQRALYFVYVHEAEEEPPFGSGKGIQADMKVVTGKYKCSFKTFQMAYNRLSRCNERMKSSNLSNIEKTLPLLKRYPKAYALASEEFKVASRR